MVIKCRFLDENNKPKGKLYTYGSREDVCEGDVVATEEGKRLVVTDIKDMTKEAKEWGDNLKYISKIVDIVPEKIAVCESIETQELIVVKQLPVIEERLKTLSGQIKLKVDNALALPCTEGNITLVKNARTELNKIFESLERQRIGVKNAIMAPYDQFKDIYKVYVSDRMQMADSTLKSRIASVEKELKERKETEVKRYFEEYLSSANIDFVSFKDSKINITLTASLKSLKDQAKIFIDRVADDLRLIDTQECKEEILVEYKQWLNCSKAITEVVARHKAIAVQKEKLAAMLLKNQGQKAAIKKVEDAILAPIDPPKQTEVPECLTISNAIDPIKTLVFKVVAPVSKLRELKVFLTKGGYNYE